MKFHQVRILADENVSPKGCPLDKAQQDIMVSVSRINRRRGGGQREGVVGSAVVAG